MARIMYIRCIYGISGREITEYTVIYGAYIRFWPTVNITHGTYYTHASARTHMHEHTYARTHAYTHIYTDLLREFL
jgi:hypothetical protein